MKKWLAVALALVLAVSLAACSSGSGTMQDGVYTAEADDAYVENYAYGWRDTLTVTYKDGVVVDATFESYDAEGNKKSTPGNYDMTPPPSEWMPELSENVVEAGTASQVDGVAGATIASGNAKQLFAAIEKDGKPGETIMVALDPPPAAG